MAIDVKGVDTSRNLVKWVTVAVPLWKDGVFVVEVDNNCAYRADISPTGYIFSLLQERRPAV